ncbi:MAG: PQQ-binding-like beta-propeller repeat protein [Euryarchaeota archaeon]|nr:PQQ-binding-like beta-propeller repeat protein [Euryarchaeota archaeon]
MSRRTVHWLAATALVLTLTSTGLIEAAYLQSGADAAKTGRVDDAAPRSDDVALRVRLPGSRAFVSPPLILGDSVLVLLFNGTDPGFAWGTPIRGDLTTNGLARVSLATGVVDVFVRFDDVARGFAADGKRVYVAQQRSGIHAYDIASGAEQWFWAFPGTGQNMSTLCSPPALRGETLYFPCRQQDNVPLSPVGVPGSDGRGYVTRFVGSFLVSLNARDGSMNWTWKNDPVKQAFGGPGRVSVVGPRVYFSLNATVNGESALSLFQLSASSGALEREWVDTASNGLPPPTGTLETVYIKVNQNVTAIAPASGNEFWRRPVGFEDKFRDGGGGFALDGQDLFSLTSQTAYRLNASTGEVVWRRPVLVGGDSTWQANSAPVITKDLLFARSAQSSGAGTNEAIYALSRTDGSIVWRHDFADDVRAGGQHFDFGVGGGVVAVAGFDGTLDVLGETKASIKVGPVVSTTYPAPGERVNVSLEGSVAGAQGAPSEYRAEWGDGAVTDWQKDDLLSHAYAKAGPYQARFQARNDAGQTSSNLTTFNVGGKAPSVDLEGPADTTQQAVQTVGDPANQNILFFAVGLAITGGGAIVGAWALRRKRNRLRQELRAIDHAYEHAKRDPARTEAAMKERRRHARAMFEVGKLDEIQLETLARRIDEHSRQSRLDVLDDRFRFLPHGIVVMLRGMIEDNRLSPMERANAIAAIEREEGLTAAQKEQAKRLVDEWFRTDSSKQ